MTVFSESHSEPVPRHVEVRSNIIIADAICDVKFHSFQCQHTLERHGKISLTSVLTHGRLNIFDDPGN